jgi:hypothetical protein
MTITSALSRPHREMSAQRWPTRGIVSKNAVPRNKFGRESVIAVEIIFENDENLCEDKGSLF